MQLYPNGATGSEAWTQPETVSSEGQRRIIRNVREPEISVYLPEPGDRTGAALVMLPGGGLRLLGVGAETDEQIRQFNRRGIAVILLKYRTLQIDPKTIGSRSMTPPGPMSFPKLDIVKANANPAKGDAALDEVLRLATADAQEALRVTRSNAAAWGIDPARVGMIGTSAGGGVAIGAMLAGAPGATPDFIISIYGPSLQDVDVPVDAPPLFLATELDHGPVTDGILALADLWRDAGQHVELHVYDVATFAMPFSLWGPRALEWMEERGFLSAEAQPPFDGTRESSFYLPSFDGTRLAVSIYRPVRDGVVETAPLPVIVTQDRSQDPERFEPIRRYFVSHGYVVVSHDRRGTGASYGRQEGFVTDADRRDAKAVIEWAASQPFSNGNVGAMGCSNQGVWQYGAAALKPLGLKAIAPACASPRFFDHAVSRGGIPIFETGEGHFSGECIAAPAGANAAVGGAAKPRPVAGHDLASVLAQRKCAAPMLGQYWLNMARDGVNGFTGGRPGIADSPITYWREIQESGVAILQLGGWFDAAVAGQIEGQRLWGGRLILGPWVHGNVPPRGSDFPAADYDLKKEALRWFDYHLKGAKNGVNEEGIEYYSIGAPAGEEWKIAETWPGGDNATRLFLSPDGLTREAPSSDRPAATYTGDGVTWFGGRYSPLAHWWDGNGPPVQGESLVHTGEPLKDDALFEGTARARIWVSSDRRDVNVFAMIEDVAPDGRSTYVTDGFLRASWRKSVQPAWGEAGQTWHRGHADDIAPLVPGDPVELVFDFFPISYVFKAGHRVRLNISTTIGNDYQNPPLTDGTPRIEVYRDAAHPSAIELPLSIAD
ncbi:CocE/NonD family hydrolase [Pelagerythrobacter marensis]|uniref:CocE/NonD family hydrolase n=1 Tax=Pelagerythrobacter marensis TaxID=543877 RepID=A0ABZ2D380_9SPHN